MSSKFTVTKKIGAKLKLLKIILDTNSTTHVMEKLIELWEEKHGELKIPETQE